MSDEVTAQSTPPAATATTTAPPMTTEAPASAAGGPPAQGRWASIKSWVQRRLLVVAVLTVLATVGFFLNNYRPQQALWYWSAMFPAFGVISIWQEITGGRSGEPLGRLVFMQAVHWLGPVLAVQILFLPLGRGQMSPDAVGMMTLLLLSVTAFLAGVHFTQSFLWVSVLLALGVVAGTAVNTYFWVLVVVSLLVVAAVVVSLRRSRA